MPSKNDKIHRCVKDVKKQGKNLSSAIGICSASTGVDYHDEKPISKEAKERHKRALAHRENTMKYASQLFVEGYLVEDAAQKRPGGAEAAPDDARMNHTDAQGKPSYFSQSANSWYDADQSDGQAGVESRASGRAKIPADPDVQNKSIYTGGTPSQTTAPTPTNQQGGNQQPAGGNSRLMQLRAQQTINQRTALPPQNTTTTGNPNSGNYSTQTSGNVPPNTNQRPAAQQPTTQPQQNTQSYKSEPQYQEFLKWQLANQGK